MNIERIKEIQQETAYPDSVSVQQALLKVWNECEQEKAVKNNAVLPLVSNLLSCVGCKYHNTINDELCVTCGDTYKNKAT
jgi:hypothetical protein